MQPINSALLACPEKKWPEGTFLAPEAALKPEKNFVVSGSTSRTDWIRFTTILRKLQFVENPEHSTVGCNLDDRFVETTPSALAVT